MNTLAVSAGPDAVGSMLWVAGILLVVGVVALLLSRRGRRSGSRNDDAQD